MSPAAEHIEFTDFSTICCSRNFQAAKPQVIFLNAKFMGIMLCPKHGYSGFYESCIHVDAYFREGKYKEFHLPEYWIHTLICDDCYDRLGVAGYENHPEMAGKDFLDIDEDHPAVKEFEDIYSKMDRRLWCSKCLNELRERNAGL